MVHHYVYVKWFNRESFQKGAVQFGQLKHKAVHFGSETPSEYSCWTLTSVNVVKDQSVV